MKFVLILSSFLLLSLMVFPCSDGVECGVKKSGLLHTYQEKHQQHSQSSELCTPFCSCVCCSSTVVVFSFSSFSIQRPLVYFEPKQLLGGAMPHYLSTNLSSIWQPPKNC